MHSETIGNATLYLGDCRELLPGVGKVNSVIADPWYGTGAWVRGAAGQGSDCRAVHKKAEGDEWNPDWMDMIEAETVGVFCHDPRLLPVKGRIFNWIKTDPRPRFSGQPSYAWEAFVVIKGTIRPIGGSDVMFDSSPRLNRDTDGTGHPHQKPIDVMLRCVDLCSDAGQTVLDPFMGSGTTGVAAIRRGRKFIGMELDPAYFEMACKRIEGAARQPDLLIAAAAQPTQLGLLPPAEVA